MRFWVGGYGQDGDGTAEGIGALQAGDDASPFAGGPLAFTGTAVAADSPSWVARHPSLGVVYAALEQRGEVRAFRRVGTQGLTPLGPAVKAGAAVCHVAVASDGRSLVASCWGDGRVVRMPLDAEGSPGRPQVAAPAIDPYGNADFSVVGGSELRERVAELADGDADRRRADAERGLDASSTRRRDRDDDREGSTPDADGREESDTDHPDAEERRDREIDLAAAARALREAAGAEFADLIPDYDEPPPALPMGVTSVQETGSAPRTSRAHQARFLPAGLVATTDMGVDLLRLWRPAASGLRPAGEVVLPRGSGPRHTVWHPSGHLYVLTELSLEVFVLAPDVAGRWRIVSATPLGPGTLPGDTAAEIALAHDRAFVYCGVRGSDTIATLRVVGDGSTLENVALDDAGVTWPRHHLVVRDTLLLAGQRSGDVVSRTLDIRSGVPGRVRQRASVPSPTCLTRVG